IWNGYSINEERKEKVAFTQAYLENKQIIMTLADSDIKDKADLKDKKVAVQNGSSTLEAINKEPEIVETFAGGEPVLFDTNHEAIMDLEAGRADAVVSDEVLARYYIKQKNPEDYKILEEDFGEEEYGIGLRKEDKKLLDKINNVLDEMRKDGSYDKIYKKWFQGNN
ncbi:TPA: transporter substrate-binding domain-containing protein, partial [Clostridioides difficile]